MNFDRPLVLKALAMASEAHKTQERSTGTPYIVHPFDVMQIVLKNHQDFADDLEDALIVACLHDVLEDTSCTPEQIQQAFGARVLAAVQALTKNKTGDTIDKDDILIDSLNRCESIGSFVVGVKACDRISNLNPITIPAEWGRKKMVSYLKKESAMILWATHKAQLRSVSEELEKAMILYDDLIPST